jgi:hypothetical protein
MSGRSPEVLAGLTGFGLIRDSAAAGSPDADAVGAAAAKRRAR